MKDAQFLAETGKLDLEVTPVTGKAIDAFPRRSLPHAQGRGAQGDGGDPEVTAFPARGAARSGAPQCGVPVAATGSGSAAHHSCCAAPGNGAVLAPPPLLSYSNPMQNTGFEEALTARVDDMLDACTKCGACFTACPIAGPAGLGDADPQGRRRRRARHPAARQGPGANRRSGPRPAWRAASASRPATTASIRASC